MLKTIHFNTYGEFIPFLFLVDHNYNATIEVHEFKVSIDNKEKVKLLLKEHFPECTFLKEAILHPHFVVTYTHSKKGEYSSFACSLIPTHVTKEDVLAPLSDILYIKKETAPVAKFSLVGVQNGRPYLTSGTLRGNISINPELSYNATSSIQEITRLLQETSSGLLLFSGDPGTGKSTLIKYLSQENPDLSFCYISADNFSIFSNPSFVEFCLNELKGAVIVLEDCEQLLTSRSTSISKEISSLLNITDGILGDLLNLKIIASVNTKNYIDSALLRKGRLLKQVEFKKLEAMQATELAKHLGRSDLIFTEETALCEVYHSSENNAKQSSLAKIGF